MSPQDQLNDAVLEWALTDKRDALARLVPDDIAAVLLMKSDVRVQARAVVLLRRQLHPSETKSVLEKLIGRFYWPAKGQPQSTIKKILEGALSRSQIKAAGELAFVVLKYRHKGPSVLGRSLDAAATSINEDVQHP